MRPLHRADYKVAAGPGRHRERGNWQVRGPSPNARLTEKVVNRADSTLLATG